MTRARLVPYVALAMLVGLVSGAGTSTPVAAQGRGGGTAGIEFTTVPPRGAGPERTELIAGVVRGADVGQRKVVIFARTNTWYVQPTVAEPYTSIDPDGKWATQTHLGDEYAALLVDRSYKAPPTISELPAVGGSVLALVRAKASE